MEDFSQLCRALQREYDARSNPFSLRDYVQMCLESLADLISEERSEQFQSAMARFFAALYGGNELFNRLPVPSRNNLSSVRIGMPPRRLFELLNDFARVINELSLLEMSSKTVRSSLQENGFPYRPNEFFSLLEQFERLDQSFTETTGLSTPEGSICETSPDPVTNKQPDRKLRGVSLQDAAIAVNDESPELWQQTKKNWQQVHRKHLLPFPIGKVVGHVQMDLYDLNELCDAIAKLETHELAELCRERLRYKLQDVAKAVCKLSGPSANLNNKKKRKARKT